ncbi:MAG: hypothetical protein STSR0001_00810 [Methanothrix sp.]
MLKREVCQNEGSYISLHKSPEEGAEGLNTLSPRSLSPSQDYKIYLKLREAYYGQEEEDSRTCNDSDG